MQFVLRQPDPRAQHRLQEAGTHPLLAQLFAARGVKEADELELALPHLLPPALLKGAEAAAVVLADAIARGERLLIVADYDCDGATACAVGLRGLRAMGAAVSYLVPNRFTTGYGLSPAVVELALQHADGKPDWIVTVDNGIASVEGVARAREQGIRVLVTDHHLPGDTLPEAEVIVNPNQPGCDFPSKSIAGVGVMFYVLLALRSELRQRGVFDAASQPRLDALLDLVALGTVADVVRLDANNRLLVAQGLKRIRDGRMQPGVAALLQVAGREAARVNSADLGFALGPRINAAGRLADMTVGIECLATDDPARALQLAQLLDTFNRERRSIEDGIKAEALAMLEGLDLGAEGSAPAISLFAPNWHEGVIGIVAGRIKDREHRPTFVFAPAEDGTLRGSGRSIAGFHLRDALDLVSKREPGLLLRFGGHAMAAGCSLVDDGFERFRAAFAQVAAEWLAPAQLQRRIEVDGPLPAQWLLPEMASLLAAQVWGQGFAAPLFSARVQVRQQRLLGERHLKAKVRLLDSEGAPGNAQFDLVAWGRTDFLPDEARIAYRLESNTWQGITQVQLVLEAVEG
ncbi:ssDNA exonuclease, 5'--_ 3'-specific [Thiomonas arsenitoxydans]|uniref:Single-stranded-DNA-specific exonuclease RecJ n=1 Tax=Thiomonas arsenitoxydans (strain DSM 22701 / CIP 110005 / 3As) TaxID=426114 RepID=D6CL86_THIA3|nr:single-stranded-DNA-specific exonuclease RecJ [Thiomonas arsenitoxydans]CAZ87839.1 Single-stranded-DNA-specific exonuclease recJ [Thiomonas arsenitoxydans]CQR26632.1 ssDNA exonuclease, 5'--> 3'-specific [Thiomonas arsenitoxydans]CQR27384.1 ssDNA exonuclease, 5'--> 3'-specific [Thiomonas arsenitoxydans]CQR31093.1 ssDNA exonuclease, 5'--> 3'-specific [Thiomonas arsenitoxydans]CQR31097.1 ssDNA exonuclease, 5'--> 3'-specific [Thiomonas arsenitoxydans]